MSDTQQQNAQDAGTKNSGTEEQQRGAGVEPSGPRGDNPSTAGPGNVGVHSSTPENSSGAIDPSAPGNTGTTPGTTPSPSS